MISATEKGFSYDNLGDHKGQISTIPRFGITFYNPMTTKVVAISTQLQHHVWTNDKNEGAKEDESIQIACKGGSNMICNVGFNYRVNADSVPHIYFMFNNNDLDWITTNYLRTKVRAAMQEISGTYTPDSLFNNLPSYESSVRKTLTDTMREQGFILETFTLTHAPIPTDEKLVQAISSKNSEKQLADQALYTRIKNENLALAQIATARGDSASEVIKSSGKAVAILKQQAVLTPTYVEFIKWSQWDGKLPTTSLGGGTPMIYSPK
jgi:regulator of protease activity HflC (stomatin/prohibitin superfamily)